MSPLEHVRGGEHVHVEPVDPARLQQGLFVGRPPEAGPPLFPETNSAETTLRKKKLDRGKPSRCCRLLLSEIAARPARSSTRFLLVARESPRSQLSRLPSRTPHASAPRTGPTGRCPPSRVNPKGLFAGKEYGGRDGASRTFSPRIGPGPVAREGNGGPPSGSIGRTWGHERSKGTTGPSCGVPALFMTVPDPVRDRRLGRGDSTPPPPFLDHAGSAQHCNVSGLLPPGH